MKLDIIDKLYLEFTFESDYKNIIDLFIVSFPEVVLVSKVVNLIRHRLFVVLLNHVPEPAVQEFFVSFASELVQVSISCKVKSIVFVVVYGRCVEPEYFLFSVISATYREFISFYNIQLAVVYVI